MSWNPFSLRARRNFELMPDRSEKLDYASRWLRDSMQAWPFIPTFFETLNVDMTQSQAIMKAFREEGVKVTYAHLIVRAAAAVLALQPEFHVMVCGQRRYYPDRVDIALSVAGDTFAAPVMIIEGADRKSVRELAAEIARRIPEVREAGKRDLAWLRKWGWVLPFGFLRRAFLRIYLSPFSTRRRFLGTFQVSISSRAETGATSMFGTSAMLGACRVREMPVVINGQLVIRPMMTIVCCADHRVFDGRSVDRFLRAVKTRLESTAEMPSPD